MEASKDKINALLSGFIVAIKAQNKINFCACAILTCFQIY